MADNSALQDSPLLSILSDFDRVSEIPETYLKPPRTLYKDTLRGVKELFDYSKRDEVRGTRPLKDTCPLEELLVEGFDDEQIWQEIELQNAPLLSCLSKDIHILKKHTVTLTLFPRTGSTTNLSLIGQDQPSSLISTFHSQCNGKEGFDRARQEDFGLEMDSESNEHFSGDGSCVDESDDGVPANNKEMNSSSDGLKRSHKQSVVDDRFFKLSDMLQFLDIEDRRFERAHTKSDKEKNGDDDDDDDDDDDNKLIDYFIDLESETEEEEWTKPVGVVATIVGRKGVTRKQKRKSKSAGQMKYSDFFDPPDGERTRMNENESDSEEEPKDTEQREDSGIEQENDEDSISDKEEETSLVSDVQLEIQSSFEKKQHKLSQKIEKLEKANLAQKPWQMLGETGSSIRPINSLLEEDVDFDHMTTTAPVITEETTQTLEDLIKQRIKDQAWDDVERKVKPDAEPFEYKKKQPLDHEKSKLSLSQIYEQEYLKQTQAETEEKENKQHTEIKALMSKLFAKLDALSNFHFTPKPPKPELKIVSNVPVLSMEEVAPVSVSDAMMLAPEEVHEKKTELKGETEQTNTDRKRKRRAKKRRQHERAQGIEKRRKLAEQHKPGLGNKLTKRKALEKLEKETRSSKTVSVLTDEGGERSLKSSSAFFSRLQDEVRDQIRTKKDAKKKKGQINNCKGFTNETLMSSKL